MIDRLLAEQLASIAMAGGRCSVKWDCSAVQIRFDQSNPGISYCKVLAKLFNESSLHILYIFAAPDTIAHYLYTFTDDHFGREFPARRLRDKQRSREELCIREAVAAACNPRSSVRCLVFDKLAMSDELCKSICDSIAGSDIMALSFERVQFGAGAISRMTDTIKSMRNISSLCFRGVVVKQSLESSAFRRLALDDRLSLLQLEPYGDLRPVVLKAKELKDTVNNSRRERMVKRCITVILGTKDRLSPLYTLPGDNTILRVILGYIVPHRLRVECLHQ